ncbi:hypothetical protein C496_09351 [Natronorubrum tibetense GA33]|uniref:Uncharacterized protein n=2 Tax=Natronorubrum tibetense TaxID=63128 RepID=L9VX30_9EURY|nr:hypothetical protein C496_09351 [Natronorubrum tibetense GA33]
MQRFGITVGALSLGSTAGFTSSVSAEKSEIDTVDLPKSEARALFGEARQYDGFRVAYQELDVDSIDRAFQYEQNGTEGRGLVLGSESNDAPVLFFYDDDEKGKTAFGGSQIEDDGLRIVDGDEAIRYDIGTHDVSEAFTQIESTAEYTDATSAANGSVFEDEMIFARSLKTDEFALLAPVGESDEITDRIVVQGSTNTWDLTADVASNGVTTLGDGHVVCDPTGNICTDYCKILCAAVGGLSGAACLTKCSATIAGIPIAPACASVCAAAVGGTCYQTCVNQVN